LSDEWTREKEMQEKSSAKIVLTASATEMSDFANNPFVAFAGGFAKGPVPLWFLRRALYPPTPRNNGDCRSRYAPYGLRKIEALLLEHGFSESDVAVVHPRYLHLAIGPDTKVVGISSMDPTGMAYVSKTYSSILGGGQPLNALEFRKLVQNKSIRKYRPKIIVGGFGSWQLERKNVSDLYGVDCVVIGEGETVILDLFRKAVNGERLPRVVRSEEKADYDEVPLIKHPAIHGCVQISRGCGRNCQFCTPTMQKKHDVPLQNILKEVQITASESEGQITLVTEDLFLYGAKNPRFIPNREAVVQLVKSVASVPGIRRIQPSHSSLAPVVADPKMVQEVAEILLDHNWYWHGKKRIVTSEIGMETGSVRLMKKYMAGKMLPFKPEQWQDIVSQSFGIMNDNDWYPLATLILGLPDEREEDVLETLKMMDKLHDYSAFYVPLFFVPLENCLLMNNQGTEIDNLTKARWELFTRCWEYNVRIWGETFLEHRLTSPLLYGLVKKVAIPFGGKVAGIYYGRKHGEAMRKAIWRMASA
jgi:radical SAM superfamily enzyme YgiQ (UPF0313 family)